MAAVLTATQNLWTTLTERAVSDPLVLILLVVLAVLLAVVLGLSVAGRQIVRRVVKTVQHPRLVEPETVPVSLDTQPPELGLEDLNTLLASFPKQAIDQLREGGHLLPPPSEELLRWQSEILNAYVGAAVLEKLEEQRANQKSAASIEVAQAAQGAILFFDLRGFTHATEHLGGSYVMRLLNVYLRQMADVVSAYGGVVDKFIGDNVMATFGVLEPADNPAQSATQCAEAMIDRMVDINAQLSERGLPSLRPSVGLASGEMVAGTLGGVKRRSFTVIGAAVNRAARLEYGTRELGVDLLMDHHSYEQLDKPPWGMKVHHQVQLRGVENPILAWSWTRPKVTEPDG